MMLTVTIFFATFFRFIVFSLFILGAGCTEGGKRYPLDSDLSKHPRCHCYLRLSAAVGKITIRWIGLFTFGTTGPS